MPLSLLPSWLPTVGAPFRRRLAATAALSLAVALGTTAAAHADLAPPKLAKPRPAKPAKPSKPTTPAKPAETAEPAAKREKLRGQIKRHPRAGTKEEMLTGRYHLYAGAKAFELWATKQVSERRMDEVAGRNVEVSVVRREIAEDRNTDVPVQRPSGGLPAKVVYEVMAIQVL